MGRGSARFGDEGRRQGARPYITFSYHRRPSGQGTGAWPAPGLLNSEYGQAIRDQSSQQGHAGATTWSPRPKLVQGSIKSVGTLTPFLPLPSLSFFAFWGVPECNTQVHPSPWCVPGELLVAGNTCPLPFLLSLSLSLSFSLSAPSPSFLLGCPWMLSS